MNRYVMSALSGSLKTNLVWIVCVCVGVCVCIYLYYSIKHSVFESKTHFGPPWSALSLVPLGYRGGQYGKNIISPFFLSFRNIMTHDFITILYHFGFSILQVV